MRDKGRLQRDPGALDDRFDLLVIGAGVYGSSIARLAALRGLRVALVDRGDLGAGASHNSLKLIHGGFRYIQHFDVPRIRESVRSQLAWMRMAPHLVRPLRFVMPTHGMGTRSSFALGAALTVFHLLAWDRNRGVAPGLVLPRGHLLSRAELLDQYPVFADTPATGGAAWYDPQMLDPTRLTFECVRQAAACGAVVVNHAEALELLQSAGGIAGAVVRCGISGVEREVRAKLTVNAAGPGAEKLLAGLGKDSARPVSWTRNMNLVTRPLFPPDGAVGVTSRRASDAAVGDTKRLFFVTPWRDCSIIGTAHEPYTGPVDAAQIEPAEVSRFLAEAADAMHGVALSESDIRYVHFGLTPAGIDGEAAPGAAARAHRPALWDHAESGSPRLITVLGIKYTTAPAMAERVVALALRMLGVASQATPSHSEAARSISGEPGPLSSAVAPLAASPDTGGDAEAAWARRIYADEADEMLACAERTGEDPIHDIFRCRVAYGVTHEMAVRLGDVIFRCTDLAERGRLSDADLDWATQHLARVLHWDADRIALETGIVRRELERRRSPVLHRQQQRESR